MLEHFYTVINQGYMTSCNNSKVTFSGNVIATDISSTQIITLNRAVFKDSNVIEEKKHIEISCLPYTLPCV